MKNRIGTLLTFHPTDGVAAIQNVSFNEATRLAQEFAETFYPGMPLEGTWNDKDTWWFRPSSDAIFLSVLWPVAGFFATNGLAERLATVDVVPPKWFAMVAPDHTNIAYHASTSKEMLAYDLMESLGREYYSVEENASGGITFWIKQDGADPIAIGFGFQLIA